MFLHDWKDPRKAYYRIIDSFYSLEKMCLLLLPVMCRMEDSALIGHETLGLSLYRNNKTDVTIDYPEWW